MPIDIKGVKSAELWPIFATVIGSTVSLLYDKGLSAKKGVASVMSGLFCGFFVTPFVVDSIGSAMGDKSMTLNLSGLIGAVIGLSGTKTVSLLISLGPAITKSVMSKIGIKGENNN